MKTKRYIASCAILTTLVSFSAKAQLIANADIGIGLNLKKVQTQPPGTGSLKFKSTSNYCGEIGLRTAKPRTVNFGGKLSYSTRDFTLYNGGEPYGVRSQTSYLYITPCADLSFDRKRIFHFQAFLPIGILLKGEDFIFSQRSMPPSGLLIDTSYTSTEFIEKMNFRIGWNVYAQFLVSKKIALSIKAEYSVSLTKITEYNGMALTPADLICKLGIMYNLDN